MAWSASGVQQAWTPPWLRMPRGEMVPPEVTRFLRWSREMGIQVETLEVVERGVQSDDLDAPRPIRVSWPRAWKLHLFGKLLLSCKLRGHGSFDKYRLEQVIMPVPAERLALQVKSLPEAEEVAVLVEQRDDPILAVRVADRWYGTHRWTRRPYILSHEELEGASEPEKLHQQIQL